MVFLHLVPENRTFIYTFLQMRAVYALIIIFLIIIIFFTQWYLCDVRGLCESRAIFEVLIMLLLAFLIGFAGSWLVSENIFFSIRKQVGGLLKEKATLSEKVQFLERENNAARKQLAEWQKEASLLAKGLKEAEPLLIEAQSKVQDLQDELEQSRRRYQNLKQETDSMRDMSNELKSELELQKMKAEKLQSAFEEKIAVEVKKEEEKSDPHNSRFTPSTKQVKNDLTLISGIGPVIQRKLNDLGIYTFQQVAELSPEMIDKITKTIKFFPDRIARDNWIGQAYAWVRNKK